MSNPSRQKGTRYESDLLADLQKIWPDIVRSSSSTFSNDFTGPFPIEAKHRKSWAIKDWIRKISRIPEHREGPFFVTGEWKRWAIFMADGDRRLVDAVPDTVAIPRGFALELFACWQQHGGEGRFTVPFVKHAEPAIVQGQML